MTSPSPAGREQHSSPLLDRLVAAGGVVHDYHQARLVRHFGDPAAEYEVSTSGVAVFDRSHRTRLMVRGRAPGRMLGGVLTGVIPRPPTTGDEAVTAGTATYHAILTPKGKMVSDLLALLPGEEEDPGFLLDVPVAGRSGVLEHLVRVLPPRFAAIEDVSTSWASISVAGPDGAAMLAAKALDSRVDTTRLLEAPEGAWLGLRVVVVRTRDVWPPAWTVYGPVEAVTELWEALVDEGARPAGLGVWSTLRAEAGRPAFGTDMDEGTLPPEAGIADRAIDHTKGCYTGQEVIVRIRDRGHVNRHLRRLTLGEVPAPARGSELVALDGSGKVVGEVTSAVQSPRFGGVIAFAYVRRGVDRVGLGEVEVEVPDHFPGQDDGGAA